MLKKKKLFVRDYLNGFFNLLNLNQKNFDPV